MITNQNCQNCFFPSWKLSWRKRLSWRGTKGLCHNFNENKKVLTLLKFKICTKVFDFSHQFGINFIWERNRRRLSVNSIFSNFESNLIGFASQICRVRVSLTITASAKPKHAFSSFCTYQWIILSHPWCSAFLYCLLIGNLVNLIFAVLTSTRQILADFFTRTFF